MKAIENKKKATKMEDGELSDSSSDNRTPTLSPTPPRDDLFRSPSFSPSRDRKKTGMHSSTKGTVSTRTDLRLVLREKEKKKLGVNDYKDDVSPKGTKDKNNKRSRSCHSQDRRRSRSRTRYSSHRSKSREREKQRDKSREKRDRSNERRDLGRSRERRRYRSRSEDRNKEKYTRGRSRSRERKLVLYLIGIVIISIVVNRDAELFIYLFKRSYIFLRERIEIDKKKLLEIARRNAINMIKQGTLPLAQQDKAIAAIQSGGKTVDELTGIISIYLILP